MICSGPAVSRIESLATGGKVMMPHERQFWGADFGMCTDKFGHHWMVNYTAEEQ